MPVTGCSAPSNLSLALAIRPLHLVGIAAYWGQKVVSKPALVVAALSLWAAPVWAQGARGPAELPPADFTGTDYTDSRGCLFARASSNGQIVWLPRLDSNRQPICGPAAPAATASDAAPPAPAQPQPPVASAEPRPAAPPEAAPTVPPAATTAQAPAESPAATAGAETAPLDITPEPPPALALPAPLVPLAPAIGPSRLAMGDPPGARLIYVEPDDRVRIIYVDMPSVLVGADTAFPDHGPSRDEGRIATRRATPGYVPNPARLSAAPPIRGFGPDPEPLPRVRRAAAAPQGEGSWQPWDGSSPAPLGRNTVWVPARSADDPPGVASRAATGPLRLR